MSNVINFSVEISPDNKDVALKSMALIAAMAEISMREMANCVEGIELSDSEGVPNAPVKGETPETKTEAQDRIAEKAEKKKSRRKSSKAKSKDKEEDLKNQEGETVKGDEEVPSTEKETKKEEKKSPAKEESEESDVTIEDVRKALKEVVHNNRDAVVAKLKELGGKNVSTLPEENYGKMYEYLISLK